MPDWIINILSKAPELASVIVVVWFALKMGENSRKSSEIIMKDWRGFLEDQNIKWQAFIGMQDEKWRHFVESQSEQFTSVAKSQNEQFVHALEMYKESQIAALARLAEEIKVNSIRVSETNAMMLGRIASTPPSQSQGR